VKTTPNIDQGKESHFSIEYRKTPLPADKKGQVREEGDNQDFSASSELFSHFSSHLHSVLQFIYFFCTCIKLLLT